MKIALYILQDFLPFSKIVPWVIHRGNRTNLKIRILVNIAAYTLTTLELKMVELARKKCKGAAVYCTHYDEGWERLYRVGPINRNITFFAFLVKRPCLVRIRVLERSSSMLDEKNMKEW